MMRKLVMILKNKNGYFEPLVMVAWILAVAIVMFILYKLYCVLAGGINVIDKV